MARHRQADSESSGRYRAKPPYAEIQKQIGKGLKEHYELSPELPHRLLALLIQLNDKDDE
jgi:hypothetical protein